jgi:hypothetical protein
MNRALPAVLMLFLLAGCGADSPGYGTAGVEYKAAPNGTAALAAPVAGTESHLAYHHDLALEMAPAGVEPRFDRARDACLNDAALNCTLVRADLHMGDADKGQLPNASLEVRIPHAGVASFEAGLSAALPGQPGMDAIVVSRTTTADDLTAAIADVDRRQAQLSDYRDRLTALAQRPDAKVDDLVKIEGELSSVQSQLEAIAAQKAGLTQRVATETLAVAFQSREGALGPAAPIRQAWHRAGQDLGRSAGKALTFAIESLPWLPVIAIGLFLVRLILLRGRRRVA